MFLKFVLSLCFICFLNTINLAQENAGPPKKDQSIKSKRKLRKADKKIWKEDRAAKRAEQKKIKAHHKRIQTKDVRKRMKRSKGFAQRNRDHQREPFFKRLFNKSGKHKSSKKPKEKTTKIQKQ